MRRYFVRALVTIAILVALTGVTAYLYLRQSLPIVQGVVSVLASGLAVLGVHAPAEMR